MTKAIQKLDTVKIVGDINSDGDLYFSDFDLLAPHHDGLYGTVFLGFGVSRMDGDQELNYEKIHNAYMSLVEFLIKKKIIDSGDSYFFPTNKTARDYPPYTRIDLLGSIETFDNAGFRQLEWCNQNRVGVKTDEKKIGKYEGQRIPEEYYIKWFFLFQSNHLFESRYDYTLGDNPNKYKWGKQEPIVFRQGDNNIINELVGKRVCYIEGQLPDFMSEEDLDYLIALKDD